MPRYEMTKTAMRYIQGGPSCAVFTLTMLLFIVPLVNLQNTQKCLHEEPDIHPKKYLHYENQSLSIRLEMSNRVTHQLATHVFKIFLQEVMGYSKVTISTEDDHFEVLDVIERLSGHNSEFYRIPKSMVNVEVWVPPETDLIPLIDARYVNEDGSVAPPGRFGWFLPLELSAGITEEQDVHWAKFRDREFLARFEMSANDLSYVQQNAYEIGDKKRLFCTAPECTNGIFTPKQCKYPSQNPCVYLLAPHYNDTKFVIDHINELNLYVKVIWLGSNLRTVVTTLKDRYLKTKNSKTLVMLSWTPSDVITDERQYMSVLFPRCELLSSYSQVNCKYELTRLAKFSWSKLKQLAEPAYNALHNFKFERDQYDQLLGLYTDNRTTEEAACVWMRKNKRVWSTWKEIEKNPLFIGGIFPITGSAYKGKGIVKAAGMAVKAINKNSAILPDYELKLLVADGQCRADKVMRAFIDYIVENYYQKLVGVLGPACSDTIEPLVGVSKYYDTMVISYSAEGSSFSDREQNYPYFFRTIGENKQYKYVYLKLFKKFGWQRVAALTEDGQKYTEYISHMQQFLGLHNITLISNTKYPRERKLAAMQMYLEDLKRKRAKIIIADSNDEVVRSVMCEAYKLGMTSAQGYVWFLPFWLNEKFYDTNFYNKVNNETVNCTTPEMIRAINGYFAMTHAFFAPDNALMQENITVGEWREQYRNLSNTPTVGGPSDYGGFAYDAVWTYALALDNLTKTDPEAHSQIHSKTTIKKFVKIIQDTDFVGVSGRIKFHGGPSRITSINIMQWYDNQKHVKGEFHPEVNEESGQIYDGRLVFTNYDEIRWFTPGNKVPDDGTVECALKGFSEFLNVECEMGIIILNLIVTFVLVIILFAVVYVIKKQYDKKVQLTQKYMKSLGIHLSDANLADLDKWEIAREAVVINRKLGEGAFGTVYGGEANFPDSGWLAVAVKTLKIGSTTEEKLDFLSEAEMMKRFDHKNIVKLLGVCTKNEPVYTIMEFMLYGDLKTFLLARRHLVNEKSEESEEISSKKLTTMALDVSRGLSYLADLKYVHRDIACRNCLVNAQRLVKLGDFGMTRPMFENDYYKFNRKGMLPVRWMSPESLGLGVFTPSSDVWSYGVLLYEIITFGSFPFQGLSNSQVLEHVKQGNTLQIPHGVKPQLEGLIKSCWQQDPKMRPTAKEIVEFLATNPRLLFPCLDVPLASVQIEDTGQLEMHLPNEFRKCSSVSLKIPTTPIANGFRKGAQLNDNSLEQPLLQPVRSCLDRCVSVQYNRDDGKEDAVRLNGSPNGNAHINL